VGIQQVQPQERTAAGIKSGHADLDRQRAGQQPAPKHEQRRGRRTRPPRVQVGHHAEEHDHEQDRSPGPKQRTGDVGTLQGDSDLLRASGADHLVGQPVTGLVRRYPPAATGAAQRHAIDCRDQVTVVEHPVRMLLDDHASAGPGPGPRGYLRAVAGGHHAQRDERGAARKHEGHQPAQRVA
jgi:hypothetical protein